jgi:catechol 2,3-dioxygenase
MVKPATAGCAAAEYTTAVRPELTHAGINVFDIDRMRDFYRDVMGLVETDQGASRRLGQRLAFLSADPGKHHQLVLVSGRSPESRVSTVNQLSFKVASLVQLKAMHRRLQERGVAAITPVDHGNAWSVYFEDPEGNTVEVYLDTPWYVPQPHGDPLDLALPDEEIRRRTEAMCRADPGFMTVEAWREGMRAKMKAP